jgi:hypothetical protein
MLLDASGWHDLRMHFVLIFGPPAVGKMTVGHEIAQRTGFKLFHNHMSVEPLLGIFEFGSPPFGRISSELRRRIIEEAVDSGLPGLVFTFVWGLDLPEDLEIVASYADIVAAGQGTSHFVELYADQRTRLARNGTEFRLAEKRSKRDREFSDNNLRELDAGYVMNTGSTPTKADAFLAEREHLRIDNTHLSAAAVADQVVARLGLPTSS